MYLEYWYLGNEVDWLTNSDNTLWTVSFTGREEEKLDLHVRTSQALHAS